MSDNYNRLRHIRIDNPTAIEFIGYVPELEYHAFRIYGADGKPTRFIGEFAPDDLRSTKVFACVEEDCGNSLPGACSDVRIVAALLRLAFPKGITQPIADFNAIENAVESKKRLALPSQEEASQLLAYAPFDSEWFARKTGSQPAS